jgi:predicted DNA-binding transcriptional regulator AlpA
MVHSLSSLGSLVTIDEVADFFRVHRKTVDKWHKTHPDFPRKIELADGSKRFLLTEIEDYLGKLLKSREQHGEAA